MKRSERRILTTHVGSMVRSPALLAAAEKAESGGKAAKDAYEAQLKKDVAAAVKKQAEIGIDIVNDGEYGKSSWANYVAERIAGFKVGPVAPPSADFLGREAERFPEVMEEDLPMLKTGYPTVDCVGPLSYAHRDAVRRDIAYLQDALKSVSVEEGFLTAVAPASAMFNAINKYYPTDREYVYALSDALREEYREIHKSGLVVQVDDAVLANMWDHLTSQSPERYREWAGLRVEALNHALEGIPEDRVRYHICFGSWHVPHTSDAPLEDIIGLVLKVNAGAYSIEAANARHEHEWRVWETAKLAKGKILIPGVITHHTTTVEHPRLVADRIVRFAKLVGRENVIAGSDCGFAQASFIKRSHASVMWAKFESLVEGAQIASKELWS